VRELEFALKRELQKMKKRDKQIHRAKYAPKQNGLPLGYPKSYWTNKKYSIDKKQIN